MGVIYHLCNLLMLFDSIKAAAREFLLMRGTICKVKPQSIMRE